MTMAIVLCYPATTLTVHEIADLAVTALRAEADLTPKPGLVDRRGSGAHSDMDVALLYASAEALRPAFVDCASAATEMAVDIELRAVLGEVGRAGEQAMLDATGGVNTHRGALWALGLLAAGAARSGHADTAIAVAARLAALPDPASARTTTAAPSHGTLARSRYGVAGAQGQAQLGFPDVRRHALPALRAARRRGADEASARLQALLALMAELDDTCVLHRGGAEGLRAVRAGAGAVLAAGGCHTQLGRRRLTDLDRLCAARGLSPGGSGDLLSATLFLDALAVGDVQEEGARSCKP
jgi:triphosphoribosyl-dephospho-CoA synthase